MSKGLRQVIWALYYEGFTVREIADELNVSEYDVVRVIKPAGY